MWGRLQPWQEEGRVGSRTGQAEQEMGQWQGRAGQGGAGLSSAARVVREKRRGGLEPPGEPPEGAGNGAAGSLKPVVCKLTSFSCR